MPEPFALQIGVDVCLKYERLYGSDGHFLCAYLPFLTDNHRPAPALRMEMYECMAFNTYL